MSLERKVTYEDLDSDSATGTTVVPVGGGSTNINITLSGLDEIASLIDLEITDTDPSEPNVYQPSGVKITGNSVGLTLGAGSGTTLTVEAVGVR